MKIEMGSDMDRGDEVSHRPGSGSPQTGKHGVWDWTVGEKLWLDKKKKPVHDGKCSLAQGNLIRLNKIFCGVRLM